MFIDAGRLARAPAPDDEVAGLWAVALEAFADGANESISGRSRLGLLFGAGRIVADALVRAHDLRVRATNHHEVAIRTASLLSSEELARAFSQLDGLRAARVEAKYGWQTAEVAKHLAIAEPLVRRILEEGARVLVERRPALLGRIELPT